ncbi:thermonuclease family protein [Dichotomicrobium thermohalophilum]|uniref:Endonuclease YncB(Thermonuclease family) n=1 Tax=Dichotomicrobium thermohalophilum TaxID=933063 RepID=A0A397Q1H7_9HYPH|nr:thermonuclease family protein [Dichotomicrobium thermohalophilum]RIA55246.1 endonuclease YncB(thermonuclease family) [Dichotomicrobium thermohalophilum]
MRMRSNSAFRRALAMTAAAAVLVFADMAQAACDLKDAGRATIVKILNTESLLLEDGRAIRLVGALAPRTETRWAQAMGLEDKIIGALEERLLGKEVRLRVGARERDRYGRLLTHVFSGDNEPVWVQEGLVRDGLAMVYSFADNRDCVRELQAAERAAREAGAGFWEQGVFRVRDATDLDSLDGLAYSFQIVEGRVQDVAESRGRIYLNFGEDWRTDFTATVAPSDRDSFNDSGLELPDLEGRVIRVRGWLERRNGPMIEVTHPEQIERVGVGDSAALQTE